MENSSQQPNENLQVAKFDPAQVYAGASQLMLTESEMKALCAPFDDNEYEIRPDGFIYIPQSVTLKRLNDVIGIGKWTLLLINNGKDEIAKDTWKVFYDGALVIRSCFVSRSVGESQYSRTNKNQSWASAFEAAKSDCRQRCCKDLGIANDAWNPTFMRRWKSEHGIRVFVENEGKQTVSWRRKDVEPFWNEVGPVPNTPTVPTNGSSTNGKAKNEFPWLNHGPDYDAAMRELIDGHTTIPTLKATKYKISKETEAAMITVLTAEWTKKTDSCADMVVLSKLYSEHKVIVDATKWMLDVFTARKVKLNKAKAQAA